MSLYQSNWGTVTIIIQAFRWTTFFDLFLAMQNGNDHP